MTKQKLITFSLAILALWSGSLYYVFATPPSSPYTISDNVIDPSCIPGGSNCYVDIPSGLPTQTGHGGEYLITDGTSASWSAVSLGGVTTIGMIDGQSKSSNGGTISGSSIFLQTSDGIKPGLLIGQTNSTNTKLGVSAGLNMTGSTGNVIIGLNAGENASNVTDEVYIGRWAGWYATNSSNNNVVGRAAGKGMDHVIAANFFGNQAGQNSTYSGAANFFGNGAGDSADNAAFSTFVGSMAGMSSSGAANSIFIGTSAGKGDHLTNYLSADSISPLTYSDTSILIGHLTSTGNFKNSIAIGAYATNTSENQFMVGSAIRPINQFVLNGSNAYLNFGATGGSGGYGFRDNAGTIEYKNNGGSWTSFAGGSSPITIGTSGNTLYSSGLSGTGQGDTSTGENIMLGVDAGAGATSAYRSNFFGYRAGYHAFNAPTSNFFGYQAGMDAAYANGSNFFGFLAGNGATYAGNSNFLGPNAGNGATSAAGSNFLGSAAGNGATSAINANFIGAGAGAGAGAIHAQMSNFIGSIAGDSATNASNSIFIGYSAGQGDTVNNTAYFDDATLFANTSILFGYKTSTGGYSNSIALGAYAQNTSTNQFMIGSSTRPINTLVLTGTGGNTCILDVTIASPSCSSDEQLKTNISDLSSDTLSTLLNVKTVSYTWKNYPDKGNQIGFLAQDLEQYFPEVVSTAPNGFKTVSYGGMTPILVEALRELNMKVTALSLGQTPPTLFDGVRSWLGDAQNGIVEIVAGTLRARNQICIDDVCMTKEQLRIILQNNITTTPTSPPVVNSPLNTTQPDTATNIPQVLDQAGDTTETSLQSQ